MKMYTIRRGCHGERYETMVIHNRETGEEMAEYQLTLGCERAEIAAMRRSVDGHMQRPGATLGNYQW